MRRTRTRSVALAVGAALLVAALALPTLADDSGTGASGTDASQAAGQITDQVTSDAPAPTDHPRARRLAHRAEARELLAAELGITVDELEAAIDRVREQLRADRLDDLEDRLADRVESEDLTDEEADTLLDLVERGALHPRALRRHAGGPSH